MTISHCGGKFKCKVCESAKPLILILSAPLVLTAASLPLGALLWWWWFWLTSFQLTPQGESCRETQGNQEGRDGEAGPACSSAGNPRRWTGELGALRLKSEFPYSMCALARPRSSCLSFSPPCLMAWSVTVSLGSISSLTCQHLSAPDLHVPAPSPGPPSVPSHSPPHRSPLSAAFIRCPSPFPSGSSRIPLRPLCFPSLPEGGWLTSSNLKCKVWCHGLSPGDLGADERAARSGEIKRKDKDGQTMRKPRLLGLHDLICLLFMDILLHKSCMSTVCCYHPHSQEHRKTRPNRCVIPCQAIVLNSATQSKTWSYASLRLWP